MIRENDYYNTIDLVLNKIEKLPIYLHPLSILWSGNIKSPGISDIDLLIGFEDNFLFANEFIIEFKKIINEIDNKDIFFFHKPAIYPISSLKKLSKFTLNDFNKIKVIYGKNFISQISDKISYEQNLINSMEFIHSRIINFLINIHKNNISLNKLLVEGHSLIHSMGSLNALGIKIDKNEFEHFNKIENLRKEIVEGNKLKVSTDEIVSMYKGICIEFYFLLQKTYNEFQKNIACHYNKNINFHQYDEVILLENLTKNKTIKLSLNFKNNIFLIDGFSWELKCLFDNLFYDQNNFTTIFINKLFEKSIHERRFFLNNIFKFNFKNFGNSYGRSGIKPLIVGKNLDRLALNSIFQK